MLTRLQITDLNGLVRFSMPQALTGTSQKGMGLEAVDQGKIQRGVERDEDGELVAVLAFPLYVHGKAVGAGVFACSLQVALEDFVRNDQSEAFILNQAGKAEYVPDGVRALDQMRTAHQAACPYDLGILDDHMPGMDGLQLARAIKADPWLASIRLVMLSSFGQGGHGAAAQQAGIGVYLTKPVRQSQLYEAIATAMDMTTPPPSTSLLTKL